MCGIFYAFSFDKHFIKSLEGDIQNVEKTLKNRGPDSTSIHSEENFIILHTLLSITGKSQLPAPYADGFFTYNGEIYNDWDKYSKTYGDSDFLKNHLNDKKLTELHNLDGEFALIVHDEINQKLYLASDPFGTKPLYYAKSKNFILAGTYDHTLLAADATLNPQQVPANQLLCFDLKTLNLEYSRIIRPFDFTSQSIDSFDPFIEAFKNAILKRAKGAQKSIFVSLSSGHDSGLIAAEMEALKIPFTSFAMPFGENEKVLKERLSRLNKDDMKAVELGTNPDDFLKMEKHLHSTLPPYYLSNPNNPETQLGISDFRSVAGYIAAACINEHARKEGNLISLSGQGVDEIISDYYNPHSNSRRSIFRGNWELANKPWDNFYGGWNRIYLGGTERISGHFGIETRYPFLDHAVVQSFLNLTPKMKGIRYKGPITKRLEELSFPFHDYKIGFTGFDRDINTKKAG